MLNIPGRHSNTPPLRVSDVLVLHSNNDRLCRADGSLSSVKSDCFLGVAVRKESDSETFFFFLIHGPEFLVPGNSYRVRPLSVLWLSDSAVLRDAGLFECFVWLANQMDQTKCFEQCF